MSSPTNTPWEYYKSDGWGHCVKCGTKYVAWKLEEEDARLIVTAVNAHENLVDVLRDVLEHEGNSLAVNRPILLNRIKKALEGL